MNQFTDALARQLLGSATGGQSMETTQYYQAMEAFCRQRAKMDGESDLFWLTEAEVLGKLATNAHRQKVVMLPRKENPRDLAG